MANIPALPTGHDILKRGKAQTGVANNYGPGSSRVMLNADGSVVLTNDRTRVMARTVEGGGYAVVLGQVDPDTIGYVNRFIADWGKVERNWRTKSYFVRSGITNALAEAVEAVTQVPTPTKPVAPEVIAPVEVEELKPEVMAPVAVAATAPVVTATPASAAQDLQALIPPVGKKLAVKRKVIAGQDTVILDKVHIPARFYDRMERTWNRRQRGERGAVVVTGPSGTAKTLMVRKFAEAMGVPFIIISGGKVRTADDWFGGLKQAKDSVRFDFQYNPFAAALKLGTRCVVLLDEGNRAETPQALNAVLSLLDDTKTVWSPDAGEYFTLPDGMLVCMTANLGAEYVGTQPMDAAVVQRFGTGIRLSYPTPTVEEEVLIAVTGVDKATAKTLVAMANHQRPLKDDMMKFPSGTGVSPRMLVDIATDIVDGAEGREAVESVFEAQFPVEDAEALTIVVDTYFPAAANSTLDVDVDAITEADDV